MRTAWSGIYWAATSGLRWPHQGALPTKRCFRPPMEPKDYIEIVEFTGQDVIGFDAMWVPFKYRDEDGKLRIINDGRIKSFEDLEKAIAPDYETDVKPRLQYFEAYRNALGGTDIGFFLTLGTFFQSCYQFLAGFSDFFTLIYTDREFVEALMDKCIDYYLMVIDTGLQYGIDVLYLGDDIAFRQGLFMNPELFKELWFPRMKKLVQPAKDAGIPVMFHSCGRVTDIIDDILLPLGIQSLNPIEPYSNDIYALKEKYGDRLTLMGNIDIAGPLAFGSPEDVEQVVKEHLLRLKPGGRFVLSSSHSIMNDIPTRNFEAMLNAMDKYGGY